jgi:hypothetical protein
MGGVGSICISARDKRPAGSVRSEQGLGTECVPSATPPYLAAGRFEDILYSVGRDEADRESFELASFFTRCLLSAPSESCFLFSPPGAPALDGHTTNIAFFTGFTAPVVMF